MIIESYESIILKVHLKSIQWSFLSQISPSCISVAHHCPQRWFLSLTFLLSLQNLVEVQIYVPISSFSKQNIAPCCSGLCFFSYKSVQIFLISLLSCKAFYYKMSFRFFNQSFAQNCLHRHLGRSFTITT